MEINGVKIYELGEGVLEQYHATKRGNENLSPFLIQKKLSRNIESGIEFDDMGNDCQDKLHIYGNMHITTQGNTIVDVENHFGETHGFEIDYEKRAYIGKKLGIRDDKPLIYAVIIRNKDGNLLDVPYIGHGRYKAKSMLEQLSKLGNGIRAEVEIRVGGKTWKTYDNAEEMVLLQ